VKEKAGRQEVVFCVKIALARDLGIVGGVGVEITYRGSDHYVFFEFDESGIGTVLGDVSD